jgi:ribonucleoside-diphosphate reductase alpha chain
MESKTIKIKTGCGNLYVTISENNIIAKLGKPGGCAAAQTESITRMASLALRHGASLKEIIHEFGDICCHCPIHDGAKSCADGIAIAIKEIL